MERIEQLQGLERSESLWTKRLAKVEGIGPKLAEAQIPDENAGILVAAKKRQLAFVQERIGIRLHQVSTNLDQAVLEYHQQNQTVLPQQQLERKKLLALRNMARRGFAEGLTVEQVDQQIQDFEQSQRPLTESLQERLNKLLQKQSAEAPQKLSEAEIQRRQALLEAITSFDNLTILERKSLEVGVIYSQDNPGLNKDWARLMNYGTNVTDVDAIDRLQHLRKRTLQKVESKIEMGGIRQGQEMTHYLVLKAVKPAAPTPPEQRPAQDKEQARARKITALKLLTDQPVADVDEAVKMTGLPKNQALFALVGQVGELYVKAARIGKITWEERQLWDQIKSLSGATEDREVPKAFGQKLRERFYPKNKEEAEPTPQLPIPQVPDIKPAEQGILEAIWETHDDPGKAFTYTQWATKRWGQDIEAGKDDLEYARNRLSVYASTLRPKLPQANLELITIKPVPGSPRGTESKFYIKSTRAEHIRKIAQLEESITSLTASRVDIAEAANLNIPGSQEHLRKLDNLLAERAAQLEQLRNGN